MSPEMCAQAIGARVNQRLLPDTELIEFVCLENEMFDPARTVPPPAPAGC